jgi:hypothetical protein
MASESHLSEVFPSGTFKTSPEFPSKTKVVLYESGHTLFLHFGPEESSFEDLTMLHIGIDGAKKLLSGLHGALVQMGEIPNKNIWK